MIIGSATFVAEPRKNRWPLIVSAAGLAIGAVPKIAVRLVILPGNSEGLNDLLTPPVARLGDSGSIGGVEVSERCPKTRRAVDRILAPIVTVRRAIASPYSLLGRLIWGVGNCHWAVYPHNPGACGEGAGKDGVDGLEILLCSRLFTHLPSRTPRWPSVADV